MAGGQVGPTLSSRPGQGASRHWDPSPLLAHERLREPMFWLPSPHGGEGLGGMMCSYPSCWLPP